MNIARLSRLLGLCSVLVCVQWAWCVGSSGDTNDDLAQLLRGGGLEGDSDSANSIPQLRNQAAQLSPALDTEWIGVEQWALDHRKELRRYEEWKLATNQYTLYHCGLVVYSLASNGQWMGALWRSFAMIVVSELGDKTFFIAALLSMRHSRLTVWIGANLALTVMTFLGVMAGHLLSYIPSSVTTGLAALLFFVFGVKLLYDSYYMDYGVSDELKEAEEELTEQEAKNRGSSLLNTVMIQSFVLTFMSEIGDRSQITTVVLATHRGPWPVGIGAMMGHMLCNGIAVCGGRMLASRISEKTVSIAGGVVFLFFALETVIFGNVE